MKPIKMLGLAALAALMAMAFVGASSASAELPTVLCKVDELPCKEANWIKHVHEETLSGSPAVLLNSVGNVLCTVLFLGDVLSPYLDEPGGATWLVIHGKFTYEGCVRHKSGGGTENCTVKEVSTDVLIEVLKLKAETAEVKGKGEVNVKCGLFINCTYNGEGLKGEAKGPLLSSEKNGSVSISEQTTNKVGGGLCPETAKLDITTTPLPDPVYISS